MDANTSFMYDRQTCSYMIDTRKPGFTLSCCEGRASASAYVVGPGDVVVLRGAARYDWKHGVARPKLNAKLEGGVVRVVTEHGAARLELGVKRADQAAWRRLSLTLRTIRSVRIAPRHQPR